MPEYNEIPPKDNSPVLYDNVKCCIYIKGPKGYNLVANGFLLYIKFKAVDEHGDIMWVLAIHPSNNRNPIFLEVPHDDFCGATRLKRLITREEFSLKVSDNELSQLQEHLFEKADYKKAIKIIRFGFHPESGVFFFANAAVKNGQQLVPDEFKIVESNTFHLCMPSVPKSGAHPFTLTDTDVTFNDWFKLYSNAHLYENAFLPACFYIMALFRDILVDYKNFSPILYLKGGAGTGKSSIVRNLTALFGYRAKDINLKSNNTRAALVKLMSQSSNTIVWMDEFYNKFEHEGLMQAAYDNAGYHFSGGVGTNQTRDIGIRSALALTSNYIPDNPIFFSRCLYVPIDSTAKTKEQSTAYEKLTDLEEFGLGAVTVEILKYRDTIKAHYSEYWVKLSDSIKSTKPGTAERLVQNATACINAAYILSVKGLIHIVDSSEPEAILADFTRMALVSIRRQEDISEQNTQLAKFISIVQLLHEERRIHNGVHYKFSREQIAFNPTTIYPLYQQKYRLVYYADPASRGVIADELTQFAGKDIEKSTRFKTCAEGNVNGEGLNTPRLSWSIDYELIKRKFGLEL